LEPTSVDPPPSPDAPELTIALWNFEPASVDPPPSPDAPTFVFSEILLSPASVEPPPDPSIPLLSVGTIVPSIGTIQYAKGTIDLTAGSATIAGVATVWSGEISPEDMLIVLAPDVPAASVAYSITAVLNDEQIVLQAPWPGPDLEGVPYVIHRNFDTRHIPRFRTTSLGFTQLWNRAMTTLDEILP